MNWDLFLHDDFLQDLLISIGIFLLFLLFRKIFSKYIFNLLLKISKKVPTEFLTNVFLAFEKPVQWLFVITGFYVSFRVFPYYNQWDPTVFKFLKVAVIYLFFWGLFNLSSKSVLLLARVNKKYNNVEVDEILIPFLSKALRAIIVAIGFTVIAQEFGYEISGFIAGLGIGGLAISLAAKDVLANLLGGVVIITEKPFSIGDWIMTPTVEGTVEDITFRSTKVRTFAQALVTVPNATLAGEPITNWSKMGKRQITFELPIDFGTPKEKLESVVREIDDYVRNHPGIHPETIIIRFNQYTIDGLGILLYFFTKTTDWLEHLEIREEINFKILEVLEENEVELAITRSRLYVDSDEGKTKELAN